VRGSVPGVAAYAQHESLGEVSFLLGTWRGDGDGEWPRPGPMAMREVPLTSHVRARLARV
jgi:hypothetical protein